MCSFLGIPITITEALVDLLVRLTISNPRFEIKFVGVESISTDNIKQQGIKNKNISWGYTTHRNPVPI
jgi:hypothetical protein